MLKKKLFLVFSFLFFFSCTNIDKSAFTEKIGFSGNLHTLTSYKKNTQAVVGQDFKANSLKITNLTNQKDINSMYDTLAEMNIAHYFSPSFYIIAS